ncbi:MAG: hypothetical protein HY885_12120 [Deltaproteobacteria bacterium]|nr:hypothetical protein [Deltaproteobacteria bacterium]
MLKEDLIKKNPLRVLSPADQGKTGSPKMGLVMSRAGLGKTAILVQIALDSMLRGNKVLHVSIGQTLDKTRLWYDDIFQDIAKTSNLDKAGAVQDELMSQRMIMTFNEEGFSVAKLQERMKDLIDQKIFEPDCLLVDGFDCSAAPEKVLTEMRQLVQGMNMDIWFSAVCHRDDERVSKAGVPAPCHEADELFDTIILLQPDAKKNCVGLNIIKRDGQIRPSSKSLTLDPSTLLILEN